MWCIHIVVWTRPLLRKKRFLSYLMVLLFIHLFLKDSPPGCIGYQANLANQLRLISEFDPPWVHYICHLRNLRYYNITNVYLSILFVDYFDDISCALKLFYKFTFVWYKVKIMVPHSQYGLRRHGLTRLRKQTYLSKYFWNLKDQGLKTRILILNDFYWK